MNTYPFGALIQDGKSLSLSSGMVDAENEHEALGLATAIVEKCMKQSRGKSAFVRLVNVGQPYPLNIEDAVMVRDDFAKPDFSKPNEVTAAEEIAAEK